jgi:HEAT repeat protein
MSAILSQSLHDESQLEASSKKTGASGNCRLCQLRTLAIRRAMSLIFLAICAAFVSDLGITELRAQEANLETAFAYLAKLNMGENLAPLNPIEIAVHSAANSEAVRQDLEKRLLQTLAEAENVVGKHYACRQLAIVGSDEAGPVLAPLLSDPELAHMARYACEGIGTPAMHDVLRSAFEETTGSQQVGVAISLGRLADAPSVPLLAKCLETGSDTTLQRAVIVALGRIGTTPAAEALKGFSLSDATSLQDDLADSLLHAGELLSRADKRSVASEIADSLAGHGAQRVQAAAYRLKMLANPEKRTEMVVAGLGSTESWQRAAAADMLADAQSVNEVAAIATSLSQLPREGQVAALAVLRSQKNPAIREASLHLIDSADEGVRVAALEALVLNGTEEDVDRLVKLITSAEPESVRKAAFETVRLMPAEGIDRALATLLQKTNNVDPIVVRVASRRRSRQYVPAFLHVAERGGQESRVEALQALEIMAAADDAPKLIQLLCKTSPGAERDAAERAVWKSCQQIADPTNRSAPLVAAMRNSDANARSALLPALARIGDAGALDEVHEAMRSDDQQIRDAGYRALSNWPDATVAEELLEIARASDEEAYRIWALRAYARVVALPSERPVLQTFEMLKSAMALATRDEDRQLIVSRLGAVRAPETLRYLLELLQEPALRETAVSAIYDVAKGLSQSHPEQSKQALETIQPLTQDPEFTQNIPKVLRDIEARKVKKQ